MDDPENRSFAQAVAGDASMAQAIVDAIDASLLVLDRDLHVVAASRSYYRTFNADRAGTEGRHVSELGDGEWDSAVLRARLETVLHRHQRLDAYEIERDVSGRGRRTMRIGAREMAVELAPMMLVEITDITAERAAMMDAQELAQRKDMLLEEMSHRVANSLMIVASILMLRAQSSRHEETRLSLREVHHRVIAIAAVQKQLRTLVETDEVPLGPYLSQLCQSLSESMIDDRSKMRVVVRVGTDAVNSGHAVHIGLIVTELVINALKHGYPDRAKEGRVTVAYEDASAGWTLTVSDDGIGKPAGSTYPRFGLGTLIVGALARRLDAQVTITANPQGRTTSVSHAA